MKNNKIKSFCIGKFDGTMVLVTTEEEFFQYIKEYIEEAEQNGQEHFDITIEETEC